MTILEEGDNLLESGEKKNGLLSTGLQKVEKEKGKAKASQITN